MYEEWLLPSVDFFELGDDVPVITGSYRPKSIVCAKQTLKGSLESSRKRETPADDPNSQADGERRLVTLLDQHEKMYRTFDLYQLDFEDESTTWEFPEQYAAWEQKQMEILDRRRSEFDDVTSPRRKRVNSQTLPVSAEEEYEDL